MLYYTENYINNQISGLIKPIRWLFMITSKQLKIFGAFARHPFSGFTRGQIKEDLKGRSNNALTLAINKLKDEDVLIEEKINNSGLLRLNLDNDIASQYIALYNDLLINDDVRDALKVIKKDIGQRTPFYALVIFGSYAINGQKKKSDLDIAIFIEDDSERKHVEASINSSKMKTIIDIDAHVIPRVEMVEMLVNDEENLGKQIARKHMAVHNNQIFYDILKEGMKHGFRI